MMPLFIDQRAKGTVTLSKSSWQLPYFPCDFHPTKEFVSTTYSQSNDNIFWIYMSWMVQIHCHIAGPVRDHPQNTTTL